MANLSAADMLKAELEGDTLEEPLKSNESAAEELKKEMLSESQEEEAAAAKADATMEDTTPSGKKRKVEAIATPDVDEDEDDEEEEDADVLAFLTSAVKPVETIVAGVGGARTTTVTTAPPLTVTGNMVEQEDTVKWVVFDPLSRRDSADTSSIDSGSLDTRSDTTDRSSVSNWETQNSDSSSSLLSHPAFDSP